MCGRFALIAEPELVAEMFSLLDIDPFPPRYNIAPTQPVLIIRARPSNGENNNNIPNREAMLARWGLIPGWVKDLKGFPTLINARAETAAEKPSFRNAMRQRRIIMPASGFFEWKRDEKDKPLQAYWVKPKRGQVAAFAALMETWSGPDGSEIDTVAVLTTEAKGPIALVHDRMPVLLQPEHQSRWLDTQNVMVPEITDLLIGHADDYAVPIPVSNAVNKVANMSADNLVEVAPHPDAAAAPPAQSPSAKSKNPPKKPNGQMSFL
jgi:putative SOS response-associated peptidase YedK